MAVERVDLHAGIGLDTRDFANFARGLRTVAPEIRRTLMLRLRAAGELVGAEARTIAEGHSQSIPPSIKVRVSAATVSVVAGGKDVPLAGLFELGNKGNRKSVESSFGHPVFGNMDVWARQPTHPFLAPAVLSRIDQVERAAVDALDEAIAKVAGS